MPQEKAPVQGPLLPASPMYFCSGQLMHFCSGVDRAVYAPGTFRKKFALNCMELGHTAQSIGKPQLNLQQT
jgi:hypothetical protein